MKSESKLVKAFSLLEKCTSVEKDLVWTSSNCDPFAAILSCLEDKEKDLPACPSSCCCMKRRNACDRASTSEASTSSFCHSTDEFFDVRVRYGHLIMLVFHEIANELKTAYEQTAEYPLVSVKHSALLSSAFQFFILTCVSPYLDQGVGIPLQLRSHVIKSWERCTSDRGFRKNQLCLAAECIAALLDCNDTIRSNLLTRYCSDIVCVFEQLAMLGASDNTASVYEEILKSTDPQLLVCTFLGLLKPRSGVKPPKSLTLSIGSRLSRILVAKNGLGITLSSYEKINGDQLWQNTPFLSTFAKQLALPPKNGRKMAYYENIASQFIQLIRDEKFSRENVSILFCMFAEEMRGKNPIAAGIFIDDLLFKPWEALCSTAHPSWSDSHDISLCLLKLWSSEKSTARILKSNPRFLPCVTVLLSLLSVGEGDKKASPTNLMSDVSFILKNALNDVENLSDLLLAFIGDASPCFELVQQQRLVQLVEEKSSVYGKVILSRLVLSRDEILGRRIESTIEFLKSLDSSLSGRLMVEIACKSIRSWSSDAEWDVARFIDDDKTNSVLDRSSWHLVAGVFFEHLQNSDIDCSDRKTVLSLLDLVKEILRSTTQYLDRREKAFETLDIIAAESEDDRSLHATIIQNAKMAVGLAGGVIMGACVDEQVSSALLETCDVLMSFSNFVSGLKRNDESISVVAADARKLASLFGKDASSVAEAPSPVKEKEGTVNIVDSIRNRLANDSPVERGGALLDAGRLIRLRNPTILLHLEEWLFEAMKEAIYDCDSYVYLAAINAVAETACYNSKYLRELISIFKNFEIPAQSKTEDGVEDEKQAADKDQSVPVDIVVRSRLCEVIGKVFRELGRFCFAFEETNVSAIPPSSEPGKSKK
ncbi:hypothetical protein Y032_0272g929 [Ancylostoma ceylanicum]|uniref:Uncharacterized protein n=1 Tax=Ancylostoma ceylanicum TaxID=53326 RepID=A0A016S8P4_9BILA|nr:hypothetical protein Y032_0272g929 [Ancylostoma ceylanicum]